MILSLGLPELVARTRGDYEEMAKRLVRSRGAFQAVKSKLMATRQGHRLFDRKWWAGTLERSYEMLWDVALAGESPMHTVSAGHSVRRR